MFWPEVLDDEFLGLLDEENDTSPQIDLKEAYELNKTRDICILCGKPTKEKLLLTTKIKYCSCVEK